MSEFATPTFILSYPQLFTPKSFGDDPTKDKKYSAVMIFDDKKKLARLEKEIELAVQEKWGSKPPKNLQLPIQDGDDEFEETRGKFVVRTSSKRRPQLITMDRELITDEEVLYPGCQCQAIVRVYAYPRDGADRTWKRGVGVGLVAIRKVGEGPRLGGGGMSFESAVDAFEAAGEPEVKQFDEALEEF